MTEEGLRLLLSTFGARLTRDDVLVPCFDMDEMTRRNQQAALKVKEK
jgi:truncated hemoglobin YjbI